MEKILLTTIVIGNEYQEKYRKYYYENHLAYAKKQGYSFHVVTDFIDSSNRQLSFISLQKILVCSTPISQSYSKVIVVDADILFNINSAGALHEISKYPDKISIVDEFSQPSLEERVRLSVKFGYEKSASEYYGMAGFNLNTNRVLNTGLMIFSPGIHKDYLEKIYLEGITIGLNHPRGFHYEQSLVGYHLQKDDMYELLPSEWNAIWAWYHHSKGDQLTLKTFFDENKAIHFAGAHAFEKEIPSLLSN
jgi:hypothetical protein